MEWLQEVRQQREKGKRRKGYQDGDDLALFLHSTLNLTIFAVLV
jgi:hypothetical protein